MAMLMLASTSFSAKPNIVLFLQDDQDTVLGGWTPMNQTRPLLNDAGVSAENWFIHTPVCCPSRAELLSGRYAHNIRMPTPKGGCMHMDTNKVNPNSFASYLQLNASYNVAWFGKHMNQCPAKPPAGFDCPNCYWFANGGGSDNEPGGYVNASFSDYDGGVAHPVDRYHSKAGKYKADTNGEFAGYTTSIIANKSIAWIRKVAKLGKPFFVAVAAKAPHVPATPAVWYETGTFIDDLEAPRTRDYNASAEDLAGHHELIAKQPPITTSQAVEIDDLFRNRWRALLSVDDAIAAVHATLVELDILKNTYWFTTSDHGYQLGQHRLPSCKLNVYDHDIRIPTVIVGPGIKPLTPLVVPCSNVDIGPTILGLAGLDALIYGGNVPMDGRSVAPLIVDLSDASVPDSTRAHVMKERAAAGVSLASAGAEAQVAVTLAAPTPSSEIAAMAAHAATWRKFHLVECVAHVLALSLSLSRALSLSLFYCLQCCCYSRSNSSSHTRKFLAHLSLLFMMSPCSAATTCF